MLDEALRKSILTPFTSRYQSTDTEIAGHHIPANTPVIHALGAVLMDPTIWNNPETFNPDNFSYKNSKSRPKYAFQPFGFAGNRRCPGYQYAYAEATVILSTLIRRFDISLVPGQNIVPMYGLVTSPKEEIWIRAQKRD